MDEINNNEVMESAGDYAEIADALKYLDLLTLAIDSLSVDTEWW